MSNKYSEKEVERLLELPLKYQCDPRNASALANQLAAAREIVKVQRSEAVKLAAELVLLHQPEGLNTKWRDELIEREQIIDIALRLKALRLTEESSDD